MKLKNIIKSVTCVNKFKASAGLMAAAVLLWSVILPFQPVSAEGTEILENASTEVTKEAAAPEVTDKSEDGFLTEDGGLTDNGNEEGSFEPVSIDENVFPDETFRAYIAGNFDIDGDGILSSKEIGIAVKIDVSGSREQDGGIGSLKGIEVFTGLESLYCGYNSELKEIIVDKNEKLKLLDCSYTGAEGLELSKNTALEALFCYDTKISALDVTSNTELTTLMCFNTNLAFINIENNEKLVTFQSDNCKYIIPSNAESFDLNSIEGLDISKVSDVIGGEYDAEAGIIGGISGDVTYRYLCGKDVSVLFTLTRTGETVDDPDASAVKETVIDIGNGSVVITDEGFIQNDVLTPADAEAFRYVIKGTGGSVEASICVKSGKHRIVLDGIDIFGEKDVLVIEEGAEVTLSAADNAPIKITGNNGCGIRSGGVLEITGGEINVYDNMVVNGTNESAAITNSGTLIIGEKAVVNAFAVSEAVEDTVVLGDALIGGVSNSGTLEVKGGRLYSEGFCGMINLKDFTVSDGEFFAKGGHYGVISAGPESVINIEGGYVNSSGGSYGIDVYRGTLNIAAEVETEGNRVGICVHEEGVLEVTAGRIITTCDYGIENYGRVRISGGIITIGGDIYDIYSGENARFIVTGGSVKLYHDTFNEYSAVYNEQGVQLDWDYYESFPTEEERTFTLPDGSTYVYGLSPEDHDEDGLYYVWRPTRRIAVNAINFPDEAFREYILKNFDTNGDYFLYPRETKNIKELYLSGSGVESLKGLEYFDALEILECGYNRELTAIDTSLNGKLKTLIISGSGLMSLDVSGNPELKVLEAEGCGIYVPFDTVSFELGKVEGIDLSRVSEVTGGEFDLETGIISGITESAAYKYDCGGEFTVIFNIILEDKPEESTAAETDTDVQPEETTGAETDTAAQPEVTGDSEVTDVTTVGEEISETTGDAEETESSETTIAEATAEPEKVVVQEIVIDDGSVVIDENGFKQGEGEAKPWTGAYLIVQKNSVEKVNANVTVLGGAQKIVFANVNIFDENCVLSIAEGCDVTLAGVGENRLTAGSGNAIINKGVLTLAGGSFRTENTTKENNQVGFSSIENSGELYVLEGASLEAVEKSLTQGGVKPAGISNSGVFEIKGGNVAVDGESGIVNTGSFSISGGDVTVKGTEYGLLSVSGSVKISEGKCSFIGKNYGVNLSGGTFDIEGGDVKFFGGAVGISVSSSSALRVTEGRAYGFGDYGLENMGRLVINGGTVLLSGSSYDIYSLGKASVALTEGRLGLKHLNVSKNTVINGAEGTEIIEKDPQRFDYGQDEFIPIFSADSDSEAPISIRWPMKTNVVFNPYNLEVNVESGVNKGEVSYNGVVSSESEIINLGEDNVKISVTGSVSAHQKGSPENKAEDLKFALDAAGITDSENTILLWIEGSANQGVYSNDFTGSEGQVVLSEDKHSGTLMTIEGNGGKGYFKINGAFSENSSDRTWMDILDSTEIDFSVTLNAEKVKEENAKNEYSSLTYINSETGEKICVY